jgi:energy-converting hydrogenase Eha subunit G
MKNREEIRNILNTVFMLLALVGVVVYFAFPAHHIIGLVIIGIALIIKVAEFFIRFMF